MPSGASPSASSLRPFARLRHCSSVRPPPPRRGLPRPAAVVAGLGRDKDLPAGGDEEAGDPDRPRDLHFMAGRVTEPETHEGADQLEPALVELELELRGIRRHAEAPLRRVVPGLDDLVEHGP